MTLANQVLDLPAPLGGTMGFEVAGSFTVGEEAGDAMHGWVAADTYSCGWPKSDPAEYQGDYLLTIGQTVPDGLFRDHCDEVVRLHDFQGSYLVFVMSAVNCPACQTMADAEVQFIADMATQGIDVHVVTLLAPSLQDPLGDTTTAMLSNWITNFSLESPVLADRGWGIAMFLPHYPDPEELGFPAWTVVSPDLEVLDFESGFTGYGGIQSTIIADSNN